MSIKVFLDMDGVCVDFIGGLHRALGIEYKALEYPYEASKYEMFEELCARTNGRVSMDNLYRACDSSGFWASLEWDPMGKEICDTIAAVTLDWKHSVCICTSPMANPDAWAGKVQWLKKHMPDVKDIAIMTAPKCLLAKPGAVLIDDKDSNVEQFRKAGGAAFLIPQPWNSARADYGVNYIPELKEFLRNQIRKDNFSKKPFKSILESLGL